MPLTARNIDYEGRYSPDRVELAHRIRNVLILRGYKVPHDWASDDLVRAVSSALDIGEIAIHRISTDLGLNNAS